jgi:NAD(P)-dependent dehydrogenase (short-subunit alcohol dehydrogenase family)
VIEATERRFGPLDAMVANAGTGIRARLSKWRDGRRATSMELK